MGIFDQIVLLLTGLIAIYAIFMLIKKGKNASNIYFILSFTVLLVSGLLLIYFGWGILANNFIAVVATLIPFTLAIGLVTKFYPDKANGYLGLMVVGLIVIAATRFADMGVAAKVAYPLFHSIAGLTIFFIPILAVKANKVKGIFASVTVGGTLIGVGGIALAFIRAGKPLPIFSEAFVGLILAPLLFLTALFFAIGLLKGEE
jgi:hypothetical protein